MRRSEVSVVMAEEYDGETPEERNEQRRAAVVEFLKDKPNRAVMGSTEHDMILADLESYREWEKSSGPQPGENRGRGLQALQHPRSPRPESR